MIKRIRMPVHPGLLMSMYWLALYFVYLLAPIHQTPKISALGFAFLFTHIVIFVFGATLCSRVSFVDSGKDSNNLVNYLFTKGSYSREFKLIRWVLLVGIFGGISSAYGKLSLIGDFSLAAVASLRIERAQNLLYAEEVKSGFVSIVAFFTYPAGFVGLVAIFLRYEVIPKSIRLLAGVYVSVVFLLAIIAGGRSPVLVLLLFLVITCYVRKRLGLRLLPDSRLLKIGVFLLFAMFISYSSLIWMVRTYVSNMNIDAFLLHADTVWGVQPSKWLISVSDSLGGPEFTQSIMSSIYYLTQNFSITERILDSRYEIVPLLGGYQIDLFAAILRAIPSGSEFLANGNQILLDANIYGYFTGAWGSLFIDFGYFSLLVALVWGYFSGRSHRRFRNKPGLVSEIKYVFWIYAILISFVSPPFGFSNSFITFVWFMLFSFALSVKVRLYSMQMQESA